MPSAPPATKLLVISGPTASGKTSVALKLARALNGEIISADSMQVYRHLSIGTAKPTHDELNQTPYHLIDHVDPDEQYHLGRFIDEADHWITDIRNRGKQPIICGGTGLYIRGLVYGVFNGGQPNPEVRQQLEQRLSSHGLPPLYQELQHVDPVSAALYGSNDRQRIIRALEVYYTTNTPLSAQHQQDQKKPVRPSEIFVLKRSRDDIYTRINERVNSMITAGLLTEVEQYLAHGWSCDNPAIKALGYRELIKAIQGQMPLDQAVESMKQKSRNYAKRQETWFRSMTESRWIPTSGHTCTQISDQIINTWKNISADVSP